MSKQEMSYIEIFFTFFKVGLFTLGGGLSMASVIRHELVLKKKLIKDDEFISYLSTATLIPGAIAVNLAFIQGKRLGGAFGAMMAILGTILPSIIIILFIAIFAMPYFHHPKVAAFLKGCAIAVGAQIAFAAYIFGKKFFRNLTNIITCIVGLILILGFKIHPILSIIGVGLFYSLISKIKKEEKK